MAARLAETQDTPKGPSMVTQLGVLVLVTLAAVGAGWLSGSMLSGQRPAAEETEAAERIQEVRASEASSEHGIVHLEPITTNLGSPADMWMRLELSLVFNGEIDLLVAEEIHQDMLAYLRTVKMHQIEGASGFQHLKSDLTERAAIRSDGKVSKILIRTLLLE